MVIKGKLVQHNKLEKWYSRGVKKIEISITLSALYCDTKYLEKVQSIEDQRQTDHFKLSQYPLKNLTGLSRAHSLIDSRIKLKEDEIIAINNKSEYKMPFFVIKLYLPRPHKNVEF